MGIGDASQSGDTLATNERFTNPFGFEALVDEHQTFNLRKRDRYPTEPPILRNQRGLYVLETTNDSQGRYRLYTRSCSKAGDSDSKSPWVRSIRTPGANFSLVYINTSR